MSRAIRIVDVGYTTEELVARPVRPDESARTATLIHAWIRVEGEGRASVGRAAALLGSEHSDCKNVPGVTPSLQVARLIADLMSAEYYRCHFAGHPIETTAVVGHGIPAVAAQVRVQLGLAKAVSNSEVASIAGVFDSALHDAYGKLLERNSWQCLGTEYLTTGTEEFLGDQFCGLDLSAVLSPSPRPVLTVRHRVGHRHPLSPAEAVERIGDGLPETLSEWIGREGLTDFTVVSSGDVGQDFARIRTIDATAAKVHDLFGTDRRRYVLEFQPVVDCDASVSDLLSRIKAELPHIFDRIEFVRWRGHNPVAAGIPIPSPLKSAVWTGSGNSAEEVSQLRDFGFAGIELPSALGPTRVLMAAVVARHFGLTVAIDELTGPGAAFVQAAGLAARVPGESAIGAGARQHWPAAQVAWAESHPGLFRVGNGAVTTESLSGLGLSVYPQETV